MSITTYGWGSGAISTYGWGGGVPVDFVSVPTLSPSIKALLLQMRLLVACKWDQTALTAYVDNSDTVLTELDSVLEDLERDLRGLENGHPLLVSLDYLLDCKIDETVFDDQLAALDSNIDALESTVGAIEYQLRELSEATRHIQRQRRTP